VSASSQADKKCTGYARAGKATAMEIGLYSEAQEMLQCPRLDIRRRELCEKTMIEKIAFGDCLSCHLTLTRENEHRHNVTGILNNSLLLNVELIGSVTVFPLA
jgi:hypothetical protein